jgi:hypothetical protein
MPSIEHQILTACAEVSPDENQLQRIRGLMSQSANTGRLIDLAVKEGMGGFVYKSLLKSGCLEAIDPRCKQKLYNIYYLTVRKNLKLLHALNRILEDLYKEGVEVVLLQGMALLQKAYEDVGLRPMKDMDLWVLPDSYQQLVDILARQKYEKDPLYPGTYRKGEIVLDIHTHLLWADRIKARGYLLSKSQNEIFSRSGQIDIEGRKVLCLSSQDHFLYLGLHALKHNFERLIWLVDIKCLIAGWEQLDWDSLLERAEELGHKKTLFYVVYLLTRIFGIRLPVETSSLLLNWKPGYIEKKILHRRMEGHPISTWAQLMMISNGRKIGERISFLYETLFPRPEVLRQVFANAPHLSVPQLYWRRMLQVIKFGRLS